MTDAAIPALRALGVDTVVHGPAGDGRWEVTLGAWNVEVLAVEVAGLVQLIEFVDPPSELEARLAATGAELVARFGAPSDPQRER